MKQLSLIQRLWRALCHRRQAGRDRALLDESTQAKRIPPPIPDEMTRLDTSELERFLNKLGVTLEGGPPEVPPHRKQDSSSDQEITLLQRSRFHDALYRIDLVDGQPFLLVLLPAAPLLYFEGYLVRLHPSHPLFGALTFLRASPGSTAFEQGRADLEEQLLFTIGESMKFLFWAGHDSGHFPGEIVVQKLLIKGEAPGDEEGE